ncbi:MAG TPA: M1 family aminopeptidase, partial [Nitrospirales bacterium]|nr:M1 family aminopeptidase [Nitrospirales bacterium]
GVYLSFESGWYPAVSGTLETFTLAVTLPTGWESVAPGRRLPAHSSADAVTTRWTHDVPVEALTLVANRFVMTSRTWRNGERGDVEVLTYLFPEDAALAEEYGEASLRYLEAYRERLGSYPYAKFAVVENFFASGLGMPSYTLLGSGVIKRHYVQPYALGHEIVHSWIGNWVLNDPDTGNWVEGLTTYLANYYYDELTGTPEQALAQRRLMIWGFSVQVIEGADYPIAEFRAKSDQRDNAIGYQKSAMVFHMLRREIGDPRFWSALRRFVAEYGGRHASWRDVEAVFARESGRDLRGFFSQWVERRGAPHLRLAKVTAADSNPDRPTLSMTIRQADPPFRLRLPIELTTTGGQLTFVSIDISETEETLQLAVPPGVRRIRIDPAFETFRRLGRDAIPPMLNLFATARQRTVILPSTPNVDGRAAAYRGIADRVAAEPEQSGRMTRVITQAASQDMDGSWLVLGSPAETPAAQMASRHCGSDVSLGEQEFTIAGKPYRGSDAAVLIACRRRDDPSDVVVFFYGLSPEATVPVARLLFFYGWNSYVIFRGGKPVERGEFDVADPLEASVGS